MRAISTEQILYGQKSMAVGGVIQGGTFKMGLDIFALMLTLMLYRKVSDSHYYHDYAQNHNSTGI